MAFLRACLNEVRGRSAERDGVCPSFPAPLAGHPVETRSPHWSPAFAADELGWSVSVPPDVSSYRLRDACDGEPRAT
jgi:hypothetical protein